MGIHAVDNYNEWENVLCNVTRTLYTVCVFSQLCSLNLQNTKLFQLKLHKFQVSISRLHNHELNKKKSKHLSRCVPCEITLSIALLSHMFHVVFMLMYWYKYYDHTMLCVYVYNHLPKQLILVGCREKSINCVCGYTNERRQNSMELFVLWCFVKLLLVFQFNY